MWVWWNKPPQNLSQRLIGLIIDNGKYDELILSAISTWEFSKLLEKGRLGIPYDSEKWIIAALEMPKLRIVHLSPIIAYRSTILPKHFQGDPANQIIKVIA